MFNNRALQVRMVKDDSNENVSVTPTTSRMSPKIAAEYAEALQSPAVNTVVVVGSVIVASKILTTACKIAVIAAKAKL